MKKKRISFLKRFIIKIFKNIARSIIASTELALFEIFKYDILLSSESIKINENMITIAEMHRENIFKVNTKE